MTFSVDGTSVIVVGGGRSGRAAAALLVSRGAVVTLADERPAIEGADDLSARGVRLAPGPHDADLFASADLIVVSPGVPLDQPAFDAARAAGVPIVGEVELASRWLSGRLVAITGTKGKSTTTTLAARMLALAGLDAPAGGNLGTALSSQVQDSRPDTVHVVEVSSFQLETTVQFHPEIAVLLNVSADHLDRHGSFEAYTAAKARIFANQTSGDWAVVNADDPGALALARGGRARRFDFALDARLDDGVTVEGGDIVRREGGTAVPLLPLSSVQLTGRHLLADVLAAAAVGCVVGVPPETMARAVAGFQGLEHALEAVAVIRGVRFINDSKATNIASARRAIESVDRVVVILGGRYKGGSFEDLREVTAARAEGVVAIGEARARVRAALADVVPVEDADSMAEAVRRAFAMASPGGAVLLAPACSSFDMFTDYAERGRVFKDEVRRLAGQDASASVN